MLKTLKIILLVGLSLINGDFDSKKLNNTPMSIYDIPINSIDGNEMNLNEYKGKFILFVNVASNCGFTRQYKDLQQLYNENSDKLVVIGVPCNQFGAQEPGTEEQISIFCSEKYDVTFPMTEKISVRGSNQHQLYKWLTSKEFNGRKSSSVKWNFQKYFVDKDGNLIDYWYSLTSPMSSKITNYIK
jgi:glutathione peroxidase